MRNHKNIVNNFSIHRPLCCAAAAGCCAVVHLGARYNELPGHCDVASSPIWEFNKWPMREFPAFKFNFQNCKPYGREQRLAPNCEPLFIYRGQGMMSKFLCSLFCNLHSLPFLPLSPLQGKFQNII